MDESEILKTYSTDGLKRTELSRQAKKEQLQNPKYGLRHDEIEKLLEQLYPGQS